MDAWHELVIEGPAHGAEQAVRAFVAGFVAGRGAEPGSVLVGADVPLAHPTLVERLRALVRGGSHAVVFVTDALLRAFGEALAQQGAAAGLRLEHARPVHRAAFHFAAAAFSPGSRRGCGSRDGRRARRSTPRWRASSSTRPCTATPTASPATSSGRLRACSPCTARSRRSRSWRRGRSTCPRSLSE